MHIEKQATVITQRRTVFVLLLSLYVALAASQAGSDDTETAQMNAGIKGKVVVLSPASSCLKRDNRLVIYLPPGYSSSAKRLPVLYMLHGYPGYATDWFQKGHAHVTADKEIAAGRVSPVILVCFDASGPRGHRDSTMFLNKSDGAFPMEDYVTQELVRYVDTHYRTLARPEARALVGLSEGGYAAVNLASKHPGIYHLAASHSGFFQPEDDSDSATRWLGPKGALWSENNPLKQIGKRQTDRKLHIYVGVGDKDSLLDETRDFVQSLEQFGIDHKYAVSSGSHTWEVWASEFSESLRFISARLPK